MADSRTGAEIYKMNLEHLVVLESKAMFTEPTTMEVCQSCIGGSGKSFQWPKLKQFGHQHKIVMKCNPNYKINTRDSILIEINNEMKENSQICAEQLQMIYVFIPPSRKWITTLSLRQGGVCIVTSFSVWYGKGET